MSNRVRSQEVIGPGVLGIAVLLLLLGLAKVGRFDIVKMVGVLIGLAAGFLCGLGLLLESLERRDKKIVRRAVLVLGPLCFFVLLAISPGLGAGYFAGFGVMICFTSSIAALLKEEGPAD